MSHFDLDIVSPDQKLYDGKVRSVQLPGTEGSFEVLIDHAPLIATLQQGIVIVKDEAGQTHEIVIRGGIIEVLNNHVVVLAS